MDGDYRFMEEVRRSNDVSWLVQPSYLRRSGTDPGRPGSVPCPSATWFWISAAAILIGGMMKGKTA